MTPLSPQSRVGGSTGSQAPASRPTAPRSPLALVRKGDGLRLGPQHTDAGPCWRGEVGKARWFPAVPCGQGPGDSRLHGLGPQSASIWVFIHLGAFFLFKLECRSEDSFPPSALVERGRTLNNRRHRAKAEDPALAWLGLVFLAKDSPPSSSPADLTKSRFVYGAERATVDAWASAA